MTAKGNKPDFILAGLLKGATKDESRKMPNLGGAWIMENGAIMLRIDAFVVIDGSRNDMVLTLFPNDREQAQ